jgi:hypothetical protein
MSSQTRGGSRSAVSGSTTGAATTTAGVFRLEGEYWTIEYAGTLLRLRDGKGLRYLAELLRQPGRDVAVTDLYTSVSSNRNESSERCDPERARLAVTKRVKAAIRAIAGYHAGLGYHLGAAVKTGARCVYLPDPERPHVWTR